MKCPKCESSIRKEDQMTNGKCIVCGKDCESDRICGNLHLFCDDCTERLIRERVKEICRDSASKDPYSVLEELYEDDIIRTRFLKNHILVGSALATAYNNCLSEKMDLDSVLDEIMRRGALIPPKACGHAGNCGSSVACGIFYSVITDTHPLTPGEQWGDVSVLTGSCLVDLGRIGGPRCCNRGALVSMKDTVDYVEERLGVKMEWKDRKCHYKGWNKNCKGEGCPFY